jgi:hypothetical protein
MGNRSTFLPQRFLMNKLLSGLALALALIGGAQADEAQSDRAKIRALTNEIFLNAGIPRAQVEAESAWFDCTDAAVERFADQPEDARTVAEAAMASCSEKEARYLLARGHSDADLLALSKALREGLMPDLLARVMEIRAARGKTQKQPLVANPSTN